MKKIVKSVKVAASEVGHVSTGVPSTTEPTPAVLPAPAAIAPAPTIVTTMADPVVQECNSLLDQVLARVGDHAPLNADEVRRSTKMKKGGAEVIPKILALCLQHKVTQIGSLTAQEMGDELKRGDALLQVGLRSSLVQKKVKESAMRAHGRSWQIGTTMYTTLQRMAVDDPELALGLEPVQSFFQTQRTKGKVRANKKASAAKKAAKSLEVAPGGPAAVVAAPAVVTPVAPSNGHGVPEAGPANGVTAAPSPAPVNGGAH